VSFTVALLLGGIGLSFVARNFEHTIFEYFSFSPEIVFYVFLPTLIFESAFHLNFRQFRNVFGEVAFLAIFGLLLSTGITASLLHYLIDLPWGVSVLFGTFISATDPIAVLAVFKELRVPQRLATIVDGESLLNDGTSLVLFQFLLKTVVFTGVLTFSPQVVVSESGHFLFSLTSGLMVGVFFGWIFSHAIAKSCTKGVQLTLSVILAHVTFLFAEAVFHSSGILATMAAGIIMGNLGKRKLNVETRNLFTEIWEFMGFIANALIFLLLGMKLGEVDFSRFWFSMLVAMGVCILIARPISVLGSFSISNLFRSSENKIPLSYQGITIWGGLRGALAAAAVLLIPQEFKYAEQLQAMTAGVIFGTFVLNATTIPLLLKKWKLVDFSISERIQKFEIDILISEMVRHELKQMLEKKHITQDVFEYLENRYQDTEKNTILNLEGFQKTLAESERETEKFLTYHALGIEMQTYRKLFEWHELSEKRYMALSESMIRQTERLDGDELPDERISQKKMAPEIPDACRYSEKLWFGVPRKILDRHRKRQIMERMQHYRGRRISSWKVILHFESLMKNHPLFHNSKILKKIINRYKQWNQNTEEKIENLIHSFPDVISPTRVRVAERACMRLERDMLHNFHKSGLISEKVYKKMKEDLNGRIEKNLKWLQHHFL